MNLPKGINFAGIYCYPDPDDQMNFFCLPDAPTPEIDAFNRPTLALFVSEAQSLLQLGARWAIDNEDLLVLREHLAEHSANLQPETIRFSVPPVSIKKVQLEVGDGNGNFEILQESNSSGFPPFVAIFNLAITNEQKTNIVAALHGREKFLIVRYIASLPLRVSATTAIAGNISQEIAAINERENAVTADDCAQLIEDAISAERLVVTRTDSGATTAELQTKVDALARQEAAATLDEMAHSRTISRSTFAKAGSVEGSNSEESNLSVSASLTDTVSINFEPTADVASWFTNRNGVDHIKVLPSTDEQTTTVHLSLTDSSTNRLAGESKTQILSLGFDAADAPINFVELTRGEQRGTLRSPDFAPVTLAVDPANSDQPLLIKTNYTDGGQAFESELAAKYLSAAELRLVAEHLGLAHIVLDGSELKAAAAKNARVHIRYLPSGDGTEDDRTIHFRDEEWTSEWFVVTRSDHKLDGVLEYELKVTTADGSIVKSPRATTEEPLLKLQIAAGSDLE